MSEWPSGPERRESMLMDDAVMKDILRRMVRGTTDDVVFHEDLMQEALVHLWLTETRRPGQTRSWYVQSCRFHVLHYLASGRSIDSMKRRRGQLRPQAGEDGEEPALWEGGQPDKALDLVAARDLVGMLSAHLGACGREVLTGLVKGRSMREIGKGLGISHTMVIRHRRRIATLLGRLEGIDAPLPGNGAGVAQRPRNGVQPVYGLGVGHADGEDGDSQMHASPGVSKIIVQAAEPGRRAAMERRG